MAGQFNVAVWFVVDANDAMDAADIVSEEVTAALKAKGDTRIIEFATGDDYFIEEIEAEEG